jgi:hypothetical protein
VKAGVLNFSGTQHIYGSYTNYIVGWVRGCTVTNAKFLQVLRKKVGYSSLYDESELIDGLMLTQNSRRLKTFLILDPWNQKFQENGRMV